MHKRKQAPSKVKAFPHGVQLQLLWCPDNQPAHPRERKPGLGKGTWSCPLNNGASATSLGMCRGASPQPSDDALVQCLEDILRYPG